MEGDTLVSDVFGDVYFSRAGVIAESRHVFLDAVGLPSCVEGRSSYTLAELGFGTGTNFLLAWDAWERATPPKGCLHYVSVEGFPLDIDVLAHVHENTPLADKARALANVYPPQVPGFHRRRLAGGRISLTLLFGDAAALLPELTAQVDGWFLDGFAPAKNPDMWSDEVLDQVARLSVEGTRLGSFTAAGVVRRGLAARGFEVEKRAGYGKKRECIQAHFVGPVAADRAVPWYGAPRLKGTTDAVTIIGAGIAGRCLANVFQGEGTAPEVIDAGTRYPAASSVPAALTAPRITDPTQPMGAFLASAFLHAAHMFPLMFDGLDGQGVLVTAEDQEQLKRREGFLAKLGWPEGAIWNRQEHQGHWFPGACAINPHLALDSLFPDGQVEKRVITSLDGVGQTVILANGPWCARLAPEAGLPLGPNRGQVTLVEGASGAVPISGAGHIIPMGKDATLLGSTYDRWPNLDDHGWVALRDADHRENLSKAAARVGSGIASSTPVQGGWVGLRATTPDHMPIAGPLIDAEAFDGVSAPWLGGGHQGGLFALTGLGSRGFQTAFLGAELVAAQVTGAPWPVPTSIARAVHPARFAHRAWKTRG